MSAAWVAVSPVAAADLLPAERAWIDAAKPVLVYAAEQRLPLDIIVQPQAAPGETPVGMAFVDGRCKLVLSMRGNPAADAALQGLADELVGPVVEAIAAHELGHCWRHLRRGWGTLPAGWQRNEGAQPAEEQLERTRREEGFADLVGLAWTLRRHPARYAAVHAWQLRFRDAEAQEPGAHDTRGWLRLAADRSRFAPAASIFEQAEPLWIVGLRDAE